MCYESALFFSFCSYCFSLYSHFNLNIKPSQTYIREILNVDNAIWAWLLSHVQRLSFTVTTQQPIYKWKKPTNKFILCNCVNATVQWNHFLFYRDNCPDFHKCMIKAAHKSHWEQKTKKTKSNRKIDTKVNRTKQKNAFRISSILFRWPFPFYLIR